MGQDRWSNLLVERAARPQPISEDRFREWVASKGVFISSRRDAEMNPSREAVRQYLHSIGAQPIMWEEMVPRDENSQQAYLNGVDQSDIFVLLVGRSYGVANASGYSPIHQEANQAAERKIPRLLFMLEGVDSSDRDGRLNDWLLSLYNNVSVGSFATPESFVTQLNARLREMAAQSYRVWIKLGSLVFPGQVSSQSIPSRGGSSFIITARVTEGGLRHTLLSFGQAFGSTRQNLDRLTWANQSFSVQVSAIETAAEFATEDIIRIQCSTPQNSYGTSGSSYQLITTFNVNGRSFGAADLAGLWVKQAVFGENIESEQDWGRIQAFATLQTASLPKILHNLNLTGWAAEGLTRLYIVEELKQRYPGYFSYLNIGSATASGIRVNGSFIFESSAIVGSQEVNLDGVVPFRGRV